MAIVFRRVKGDWILIPFVFVLDERQPAWKKRVHGSFSGINPTDGDERSFWHRYLELVLKK